MDEMPRQTYVLRPVVVPEDLSRLHGPGEGKITLPQQLCWSKRVPEFDLGDDDQALEMYELVLDAARSPEDFAGYFNEELLARLWPELDLAPRVKQAWEDRHPSLTRVLAAA